MLLRIKVAKIGFIAFAIFLVHILGWFVYKSFRDSGNLSADIVNSTDYTIALRNAERIRFLEFAAAAVFFPGIVLLAATFRLPRLSWLRTLLAAAMAFLGLFAVCSVLMETTFQQTFPGSPLPLSALLTIALFGGAGILFSGTVFFAIERIHVWKVARA